MTDIRKSMSEQPVLANNLVLELNKPWVEDESAETRQLLEALVSMYTGNDVRYLNFYGPSGTIETIPYHAIVQGQDLNQAANELNLVNKVAFVGFSDLYDPVQPDRFYTVFISNEGYSLSGVEIAATAFGNLLHNQSIRLSDAGTTLAILFVFGLSMTLLIYFTPAHLGVPAAIIIIAGYVFYAQVVFNDSYLWLPLATPVLVQFADVAGSAGLAFVLAGINTLLALAWHERARPRASLRRIEAAATLLVLLSMYGLHRLTTTPLTSPGSVGVVQTAVAVDEKWRAGTEDLALRRTLRLTDRVRREGNPDLIVWPETTLRTPIGQRPDWGARIAQLARSSGAMVVAGSVAESGSGMEGSPSGRRTNAALAFDPTARGPEQARVIHEKQKLVPFVERVGPRWLNLSPDERRGFTAGEGLVTSNGRVGRYGAVVCYELTFPELARTLRRDGASLLVVVSNDAWLGRTTAVAQHFAHGVLRAVENRMAVVRSSNAGISGVIDPLGRVVARTESLGEDVVVGSLYRTGTAPLVASIEGWAGPVALVLLILL